MAAQPRYDFESSALNRASAAVVVPADGRHGPIDSPAAALQARLDAAIGTRTWGSNGAEQVERWPGAVRVSVLLVGAVGSWALVWQAVQLVL